MLALYIVLGFLFLIALILFSSISVNISINPEISLDLRFWFLKFKIPLDKKNKPEKEEKSQSSEEPKPHKKNYFKDSIKNKGIAATVTELFDILKVLFSEFDRLLKHLRIKKFKLLINVASHDPAVTAVEYGAVCAVVFPAVKLVEDKTKLSRKGTRVTVNSDFNSEKPELIFDAKLKLRVIRILISGLSLLKLLIKLKMADQNKETENKSK